MNGNEPAMPNVAFDKNGLFTHVKDEGHFGLTIRQHFAGLAMRGMLAASGNDTITSKMIFELLELPADTPYEYPKHYMAYVAKSSVVAADALIAALNA